MHKKKIKQVMYKIYIYGMCSYTYMPQGGEKGSGGLKTSWYK